MPRNVRRRVRTKLLSVVLLIWALFMGFAWAAVNTVPLSRLDEDYFVPDPNQMKPDECGGITVQNLVVASGLLGQGTPNNDLLLGSLTGFQLQTLAGDQGDDCIVAAANTLNFLLGNEGNDVLIGHPSSIDTCFGGPGNDLFYNCEIVIQWIPLPFPYAGRLPPDRPLQGFAGFLQPTP